MDIDMIRRHLAMAERHVLEGTQRLRRQRELIEQLRQDSREAKMALKLLSEFEESFALAVEDRDLVRSELERAEGQPADSRGP